MTLSEIRAKAGSVGGKAPHKRRGWQCQSESWRKDNARKAGEASAKARKEKRDEVVARG